MPRKSLPRARIQGNLDGLCGVYAVVNSVRNMSPKRLNGDQEKDLFRQLIGMLGEEDRLEDALCNGMTVRPLGRLIDAASSFLQSTHGTRLGRQLAFRTAPEGLQQFWEAIVEHLDEHGPGSVLLGLGGKHDHWTCVGTMSENTITLIDSDGILASIANIVQLPMPKAYGIMCFGRPRHTSCILRSRLIHPAFRSSDVNL